MTSISVWPILVATLAAFAIGALWYSPILFGKQWMALTKMTDADVAAAKEKGVAVLYVVQLVITVVTFAVLAFFISATQSGTPGQAMFVAFLAWLGFPLMGSIAETLWQKKSWRLIIISTAGTLVSWLVGAAIIGAWH